MWENRRYDLVHTLLAISYLILALIGVHSIIRGWTKSKHVSGPVHAHRNQNSAWLTMFYPLFLLGTSVRTSFFVLQPLLMEDLIHVYNSSNFFLNTLPSFFFFATYLIILFRWAEIYHNSYELSTMKVRHLQKALLYIVLAMFATAAVLYVIDFTVCDQVPSRVAQVLNNIEATLMWYSVGLYLATSLGFIFYGVGLYRRLSAMPKFTNALIEYCQKIQRLTTIVCLVFLIRGILIIVSITIVKDISEHWWFDGLYFFGLEVIPLILMLFILKIRRKEKFGARDSSANVTAVNNSRERSGEPSAHTPLLNNV